MATIATNHVSVAMGQVVTSLPRYSHFFISNYIIPSHYDQMLFFSVYVCFIQTNCSFPIIVISTSLHLDTIPNYEAMKEVNSG